MEGVVANRHRTRPSARSYGRSTKTERVPTRTSRTVIIPSATTISAVARRYVYSCGSARHAKHGNAVRTSDPHSSWNSRKFSFHSGNSSSQFFTLSQTAEPQPQTQQSLIDIKQQRRDGTRLWRTGKPSPLGQGASTPDLVLMSASSATAFSSSPSFETQQKCHRITLVLPVLFSAERAQMTSYDQNVPTGAYPRVFPRRTTANRYR